MLGTLSTRLAPGACDRLSALTSTRPRRDGNRTRACRSLRPERSVIIAPCLDW